MYEAAEYRADNHFESKGLSEHDYTAEEYAEAVKVELPVFIGKIDCVDHHELCMRKNIRAYPTLKFFVDGDEKGDYRGHRTVMEFTHFLAEMEDKFRGEDEAKKTEEAKEG